MNQLGLAIDVSHSSDRTSLDVCRASSAPVLLTHAGARAVWDTARMKPDDVLRAVADTGGVVGMSAAPHTTLSAAHPRHTIESVMDHFRYCVDLLGIEHVAFGPDTLYGDHVGLHTVFADLLQRRPVRGAAAREGRVRRRAGEPDGELHQHLPAGWCSRASPTTRSGRSSAATSCARCARSGSDALRRARRLGEEYFSLQHSTDPFNATLLGVSGFDHLVPGRQPRAASAAAARRFADARAAHRGAGRRRRWTTRTPSTPPSSRT